MSDLESSVQAVTAPESIPTQPVATPDDNAVTAEPEFVEEILKEGKQVIFLCHNCKVKVAIVCSPQRTPKFCNFCGKRVEPSENL